MDLHKLPSLRTDERGMGLLFGLMCAAIVAVLTWTMMTNGLVDMTIADNYRSKSTAFYAADAGVEQTLVDLKVDDSWINTFVDLDTWQVKSGLPATIDINGNTVALAFDSAGNVIPQYYPVGSATTLGDGTYVRELYLPPIVAPGDCASVEDPSNPDTGDSGGGSSSGSSGSGSSTSGSSSSGSSGSGSSTSGSSSSGSSGSGSSSDFLSAAVDTLGDLVSKAGFLLAPAGFPSPENVTICHVPPGDPGNAHSISISSTAWPAHEAHGDSQGACADGSGSSSSGSSSSGSGVSTPTPDVYPYDPCDLLADIDASGDDGGSSSSGSGSSSSGSSSSGSSSSGSSNSGSSNSGSSNSGSSSSGSSSPDDFASMIDTHHGDIDRALLLVAGGSMMGNGPKVTICHVPPGDSGNEQTLSVGSSAVGAHLSNHPGDSIGACESSSGSSSSGSSSSDCNDSSSGSSSSDSSSSGSSSSGSSSGGSSSGSSSSGSSSSGSSFVAAAADFLGAALNRTRVMLAGAFWSDSGSSSSGSSSSGSSSSGTSSSGSSGSGSDTCDGADGGSGGGSGSGGDSGSSVSSYVIFAVRSTGSGGLTEQSSQVIVAELSFLLGSDENVYDIAVQNWRREH